MKYLLGTALLLSVASLPAHAQSDSPEIALALPAASTSVVQDLPQSYQQAHAARRWAGDIDPWVWAKCRIDCNYAGTVDMDWYHGPGRPADRFTISGVAPSPVTARAADD